MQLELHKHSKDLDIGTIEKSKKVQNIFVLGNVRGKIRVVRHNNKIDIYAYDDITPITKVMVENMLMNHPDLLECVIDTDGKTLYRKTSKDYICYGKSMVQLTAKEIESIVKDFSKVILCIEDNIYTCVSDLFKVLSGVLIGMDDFISIDPLNTNPTTNVQFSNIAFGFGEGLLNLERPYYITPLDLMTASEVIGPLINIDELILTPYVNVLNTTRLKKILAKILDREKVSGVSYISFERYLQEYKNITTETRIIVPLIFLDEKGYDMSKYIIRIIADENFILFVVNDISISDNIINTLINIYQLNNVEIRVEGE